MMDYAVSGMVAVYQSWFNSERRQSIEEISDIASRMCLTGAARRGGGRPAEGMSGGNTMTNAKEKKKIVLWLIVLAILAAAAFTVTAIVRHNQRPAWDGGYSVHISEVMTDNKTCPNGEGVLCDWIEIENYVLEGLLHRRILSL